MWHPFLFFGLLATIISYVHATALTYKLAPNEKACFFADVLPAQANAKIAFYFAVCFASPSFASTPPYLPPIVLLTRFSRKPKRENPLSSQKNPPHLTSAVNTGPIRRLLRHRHRRHRAQLQTDPERAQATPGRLRLHRPERWRIQLLLHQQRILLPHRKDGRHGDRHRERVPLGLLTPEVLRNLARTAHRARGSGV